MDYVPADPGCVAKGENPVKQLAVFLAAALVVTYAAHRVMANEAAHKYPPAACVLLGGHWDIWDGWRCG